MSPVPPRACKRAGLQLTVLRKLPRRHNESTYKAAGFVIAIRASPQVRHHYMGSFDIYDTTIVLVTVCTSTRSRTFRKVLPLKIKTDTLVQVVEKSCDLWDEANNVRLESVG